MKKLTLLTLNIGGLPYGLHWFSQRAKKIAEALNQQGEIDIIYFQEIITYIQLRNIKKQFHIFPYCVYRRSFLGPMGGLVIFSKVPIEYSTYTIFSKQSIFFDWSMFEAFTLKGMLIAQVKNSNVMLLNTHFNANHDDNWTKKGRYYHLHKLQIREFHSLIKMLSKANTVVLAAGDFNIVRHSTLYTVLRRVPGLIDVFQASNQSTFHLDLLPKTTENYIIDYIFTIRKKSEVKIVEVKHLFTEKVSFSKNMVGYVSDHVGLQTTVLVPSISKSTKLAASLLLR